MTEDKSLSPTPLDCCPFCGSDTCNWDCPDSRPGAADAAASNGNVVAKRPDVDGLIGQYTEFRTVYDLEMAALERARAEILAQVQDQLDAISAEFTPRLAEADAKIKLLDAVIKEVVKVEGKTCKGRRWEFRYTSGKRTVSVKDVETLAKIKDDNSILNVIKVGDPSVAVYPVK